MRERTSMRKSREILRHILDLKRNSRYPLDWAMNRLFIPFWALLGGGESKPSENQRKRRESERPNNAFKAVSGRDAGNS